MKFDIKTSSQSFRQPELPDRFWQLSHRWACLWQCLLDLKQRLLESYHRRGGRQHRTEHPNQQPAHLSTSQRSTHRPALKCVESCRSFPICWFVVFCLKSGQKSPHVGEKFKKKPEKSEMVQQWLNKQWTSGFLFLFKPEEHDALTLCLWSKHNILVYDWLQTELTQDQRGN